MKGLGMPISIALRLFSALAFLTLSSAAVWAQPSGADIFSTSCASCHQATGQGLPEVFPPLAGHVSDIFAVEGGPRHLMNVLLFGMQGPITVAGNDYNGAMPNWYRLSDEDISAVLDYVMTAWGDAGELGDAYQPVTVEQVAEARRGALSPQLVHQRRPDIATGTAEGGEGEALEPATFTTVQIESARPLYNRLCAECHGNDLNGGLIGGPPLRGAYFDGRWGGQSVAALYAFTKSRMPQNRPDSLTPQQYADLVALILSENGHEAGDTALTGDARTLEGLGIRDN
jgi:mono/diheme cytochrome c family protein